MKSFSLEKISLLSNAEQSAKEFNFSDGLNIITGKNGVGKSCLMKSLYWAFGADSEVVHPSWKNANVSVLVIFKVKNKIYKILRDENHFFIFDSSDNLLGRFKSVTKELGPFFADLFDFHLQLPLRTGEEYNLPSRYYLAPFYIDQDTGWDGLWNSFKGLGQFSNWKPTLLEYFTGSLSNEFLSLKNDITFNKELRNKIENQKELMDQTFEEIQSDVSNTDFDFDTQDFENEIKSLLEESERLKGVEYKYKDALIKLSDENTLLNRQIKIINASIGDIGNEKQTLLKSEEEVECPTCGADYDNNFAERFDVAKDLFRCEELQKELSDELAINKSKTDEVQQNFLDTSKKRQGVIKMLERKKGKVSLQDHIKTQGEKKLRTYLRDKVHGLRIKIQKLDFKLKDLEKERRAMATSQKEKKKVAHDLYLRSMRLYLEELHVTNLTEESYTRFDRSNINESGSDRPRAILAYFFSVQKVIREYYTGILPPIVIDSPNQQDQDSGNEDKIYEFIINHSSGDHQIILGLADGETRDFGNATKIVLETEGRLLSKLDYKNLKPKFTALLAKGLL